MLVNCHSSRGILIGLATNAGKHRNAQVAQASPIGKLKQFDRARGASTSRPRAGRWGHRDATAILLAYRHGLRASELIELISDDVDFSTAKLHVRPAKGGMASVHPLTGRELRARLQRETPEGARSVHVFVSERRAPLSIPGYRRMVARAGAAAGFVFVFLGDLFAAARAATAPVRSSAPPPLAPSTRRRCAMPL